MTASFRDEATGPVNMPARCQSWKSYSRKRRFTRMDRMCRGRGTEEPFIGPFTGQEMAVLRPMLAILLGGSLSQDLTLAEI